MPYIIGRSWYSPNQADAAVKKYLETMEKYPFDESLGKQIVQVATTVTKEGLSNLTIMEVEQQKVGDALEWAKRFMLEFRTVEGFTYEVKTWSTAEEALARIGVG